MLLKKIKASFWMRSMMFTLMLRFSLILFGFGTYALLAHFVFDNTQMGFWAMYTTIITTIELTKQGLLRNAMIKFMHSKEFEEDKAAVQSASVIISVLFTILISILLLLTAHSIAVFTKSPPLESLLYLSIPYLIVLIPFNHFEIILQGNFEYKHNFYAYVIRQGLFFLYVVLGMLFYKQGVSFHLLLIVQMLTIVLSGFYLYKKAAPFLYKTFVYNKTILTKLLHFGKYVFGTALFGNLARSADHFVTANMLNSSYPPAVSYYNVVARISSMMDSPAIAAADILFPKNAQAGEMEGLPKVKYYFERMVATLTALIIPMSLLILLVPKFILLVSGGKNYLEAIPILQVMAIFAVLRPFVYNFGHTVDAIGKPELNFWVNAIMMLVNFTLTWLFIKSFGLMGAAYASALMYVLYVIVFYVLLKKYLNIEWRNIFIYIKLTYVQLFTQIKKVLVKN